MGPRCDPAEPFEEPVPLTTASARPVDRRRPRGGGRDELAAYRAIRNGDSCEAPQSLGIIASAPGQQIAPGASSDHRVVFFSADGTLYRAVRDGETFQTAVRLKT
jgi:hypothetical protein